MDTTNENQIKYNDFNTEFVNSLVPDEVNDFFEDNRRSVFVLGGSIKPFIESNKLLSHFRRNPKAGIISYTGNPESVYTSIKTYVEPFVGQKSDKENDDTPNTITFVIDGTDISSAVGFASLACYIKSDEKLLDFFEDMNILAIPELTPTTEQVFQQHDVWNLFYYINWNVYAYRVDKNLLTMNKPELLKEYAINGNMTSLVQVSNCIYQIQKNCTKYGIERAVAFGPAAVKVLDMYKSNVNKNIQNEDDRSAKKFDSFRECIIIDRLVDPVSLSLPSYTYEGLMSEYLNYDGKTLMLGECCTPNQKKEIDESVMYKKMFSMTLPTLLTAELDPQYAILKNVHGNVLGSKLDDFKSLKSNEYNTLKSSMRQTMTEIKNNNEINEKQYIGMKNFNEIKNQFSQTEKELELILKHVWIVGNLLLKRYTKMENWERNAAILDLMQNSQKKLDYIWNIIISTSASSYDDINENPNDKGNLLPITGTLVKNNNITKFQVDANLIQVLQYLILYSHIQGGIKGEDFLKMKKAIIAKYGAQHEITFAMLDKMGWIIPSSDSRAKETMTWFRDVKRYLKFVSPTINENSIKSMSAIDYVFNFVAPISIRLCECILFEKWAINTIEEASAVEQLNVFKINKKRNSKAIDTSKCINQDLLRLNSKDCAQKWAGSLRNECVFDISTKKNTSECKEILSLVVFVGGVTLAELSALAVLERRGKELWGEGYNIIVVSTDIGSASRILANNIVKILPDGTIFENLI